MKGTVYLIHLETKISHAQHYIGWTRFFKARLAHHRNGTGSRLLRAATLRGIAFDVVPKWKDVEAGFERKLKLRKNARRLCPVCRKEVTR